MADYWLGDDSDVRRLCREIIESELSLHATTISDDTIVLQLKLGDEPVGKPIGLGLDWETDHGHGGGDYISGFKIREVGS